MNTAHISDDEALFYKKDIEVLVQTITDLMRHIDEQAQEIQKLKDELVNK